MLQPIPLVSGARDGGSAANRPSHAAALQLDGGKWPSRPPLQQARSPEFCGSSAGRGADASDLGAADFGGKGPRLPSLRLGPALLSPRPTLLSPGPRGDWSSAGGGADPAFSPATPAVSSAQQCPLTLPAKRPAAVVVLEEEYRRAGVGGSAMRMLLSIGQQAAAGEGDGSRKGGGGGQIGRASGQQLDPFRSSLLVALPVHSGHGWVAWAMAPAACALPQPITLSTPTSWHRNAGLCPCPCCRPQARLLRMA